MWKETKRKFINNVSFLKKIFKNITKSTETINI